MNEHQPQRGKDYEIAEGGHIAWVKILDKEIRPGMSVKFKLRNVSNIVEGIVSNITFTSLDKVSWVIHVGSNAVDSNTIGAVLQNVMLPP